MSSIQSLRLSTTEKGWTIHIDDLVRVKDEVSSNGTSVSLEQVEDVILALSGLGYLILPQPVYSDDGDDKCANWKPLGTESLCMPSQE